MVIALDPVARAANEAAFQASFAPRPMATPATPMPAVSGAPSNSYVPGPFDPTPIPSSVQTDINTAALGGGSPISNLLGIASAGDLASRLITGQGIAQNLGLPNPIDAIRSIGGNALSNVQGWLSGSPAQTFPVAPGFHPITSPFTPAGQAAAAYPNPNIGFIGGRAADFASTGAGAGSAAALSGAQTAANLGFGSSAVPGISAAAPSASTGAGTGFLSGMGGLSATLPIALPAAFAITMAANKLMGADSTKPQKWMGMSGVRAYDPDFEGTLQDANRIAYLAAAAPIGGEYQPTKIPGEFQQRFGLPAIVTPEMFRAAIGTRIGGIIQREAEANRIRSFPEGYGGP